MKAVAVRAILGALNAAQVRYLIVGGLAVAAYGHVRYTVDVDLVIALDPENVRRSNEALTGLGYRPSMPVRMEDLADAVSRERWAREKGMVVFQLVSDQHPETPIDIFVTEPFDFEAQYGRASRLPLPGNLIAPVVALDQLLTMKMSAARSKDLQDFEVLRKIHDIPSTEGPP